MKKSLLTFVAVLLASLIAYSGSGVNIYFYCCNDCRAEGSKAVTEHKCCDVHHHHHLAGLVTHYDDHNCTQHISEVPDECGVERISVLWESSSNDQLQVHPVSFTLDQTLFVTAEDFRVQLPEIQFRHNYIPSQKPPNLSGEDYFSLLTTLII